MGNSLGLLLLRLGFGGYILAHGIGKFSISPSEFPDPLGMGNTLSYWSAIGAEVGCAAMLIVGFWTRLAAIPLAFTMGVAAFAVHANDPWMMGEAGSKEPALLYGIVFLALVFTGAGHFSVDGKRAAKAHAAADDQRPTTSRSALDDEASTGEM